MWSWWTLRLRAIDVVVWEVLSFRLRSRSLVTFLQERSHCRDELIEPFIAHFLYF